MNTREIIIEVLSLGCGETYAESLSLFNGRIKVCGEHGYICYRCENRINMINKKLNSVKSTEKEQWANTRRFYH